VEEEREYTENVYVLFAYPGIAVAEERGGMRI